MSQMLVSSNIRMDRGARICYQCPSQTRSVALECAALTETTSDEEQVPTVHVTVRDNNVDQALKALKKKMQREGIFREMKMRRHYEKPSEKRAREKAEAIRRTRKLERKRLSREE